MQQVIKVVSAALIAVVLSSCGDPAPAPAPEIKADIPETPPPPPPPPPPSISPLDLSTLVSSPDWASAKVTFADGAANIVSHSSPGGFSAHIPIPETARKAGAGRVKVTIQVTKGGIFVSAYPNGDGTKRISPDQLIKPSEVPTIVELPIEDLSQQADVLFANGAEKGQSTAVVTAIEVVQP